MSDTSKQISRAEYVLRDEQAEVERGREALIEAIEWLGRDLERAAKALREWDGESSVPVNTCGIIQSRGASIDLAVGALNAHRDAAKRLAWALADTEAEGQ